MTVGTLERSKLQISSGFRQYTGGNVETYSGQTILFEIYFDRFAFINLYILDLFRF